MTFELPSYLDQKTVKESVESVLCSPLGNRIFAGHFTLGPAPISLGESWVTESVLGGLSLSRHQDVDMSVVKDGEVEAVLLGDAFLTSHPELTNGEILAQTINGKFSFEGLLDRTDNLFGRWVIFVNMNGTIKCYGDAWNSFPIFFGLCENKQFWLASSPKLIGAPGTQDVDIETVKSFLPHLKKDRAGGQYPVDITPYYGIHSLLPNHCLELSSRSCKRIWPRKPLEKRPLEETVEYAADQLRELMVAIGNRRKISVGVTGGTDSRLLLAALIKSNANYTGFTGVMKTWCASEDHFDVVISKQITAAVGAPHEIVYPPFELSEEQEAFYNACSYKSNPIACRRALFSMGWKHRESIQLVGWGSEINRRYWNVPDRDNPYLTDFVGCLGYRNNGTAARALAPWVEDAREVRKDFGVKEFDLLYWEMRLGRWAADSLSDLNLGQLTLSPFSSREWFSKILGATGSRQEECRKFYELMTNRLEPRFSDYPLNPFRKKHLFRRFIKSFPSRLSRLLLKFLGLYHYRKHIQNKRILEK